MANKDVERALMEALGMNQRPRMRPKGMGESGKTISDADRAMIREMLGDQSLREKKPTADPMDLSPQEMLMLEKMMKQQQMEQGAAERKAFPPPSMMNRGGKVMGYEYGGVVGKKVVSKKKKPKMGAVMKGRGGSYKGIK